MSTYRSVKALRIDGTKPLEILRTDKKRNVISSSHIDATTEIQGVLPPNCGGTGLSSLEAELNQALVSNGEGSLIFKHVDIPFKNNFKIEPSGIDTSTIIPIPQGKIRTVNVIINGILLEGEYEGSAICFKFDGSYKNWKGEVSRIGLDDDYIINLDEGIERIVEKNMDALTMTDGENIIIKVFGDSKSTSYFEVSVKVL